MFKYSLIKLKINSILIQKKKNRIEIQLKTNQNVIKNDIATEKVEANNLSKRSETMK